MKDNSWWDGCHDFIQWIFPTRTISNYCADAPILTQEVAKVLFDKHIAQVYVALKRFANFLRSQDMSLMNHNHLRITRMLESISLICDAGKTESEVELLLVVSKFLPVEPTYLNDIITGQDTGFALSKRRLLFGQILYLKNGS